jgi:protein ImuB
LISGSLQPLSAGSLDAFAGLGGARAGVGAGVAAGRGRDSVPHLVERLRARLGEDAVYGVAAIPEHRPEAAWRRVHELSLTSTSRGGEKRIDAVAGDGMPRPVWLLDAPLPLPLPLPEPDLQHHQSGLILEEGPERIESGWWDGKGVARDYYVARQVRGAPRSHGAKLWVFQERHSRRWYVHGMFA